MRTFALACAALLSGCAAAGQSDAPDGAATSPIGEATPNPAHAASPAAPSYISPVERIVVRDQDGFVRAFAPMQSRDRNDLVAGCPHMFPARRPRGSNCYGIYPEECGADRARGFVGQNASADVRARIVAFSPNGDVRFIMPGEPVIQDLRPGRLNIELDAQGAIAEADCY